MYKYWRDAAGLRLSKQSHNPLESSNEESLQTVLFLCYNNCHEDYFFSHFWNSFQTAAVQHAQSFDLGFLIVHRGSVACLSMIATSPSYFEFSCPFIKVSDVMLHFVLLASISFVQHFHVTYMDDQG